MDNDKPVSHTQEANLRLVQFEATDGLRLNGLLADAGSDITIIHIHGKGGNFYENNFVRKMYSEYPKMGFNFLAFNNRGHSTYVEAYHSGQITYVGSAVEEFKDCLLDLDAAIKFAHTIGQRVVLQGHSFGCEKITFYALYWDASVPLVLLSPCDGYRLQEVYRHPETVSQQLLRLKEKYALEGLELLPPEEYGIRVSGIDYHVPITARALVSLMSGIAFRLFRCDFPWADAQIENNCFVYLGQQDALQVDGAEAMRDLMQERFLDPHVEIHAKGDHQLRGAMPEVIASIGRWIHDVASSLEATD